MPPKNRNLYFSNIRKTSFVKLAEVGKHARRYIVVHLEHCKVISCGVMHEKPLKSVILDENNGKKRSAWSQFVPITRDKPIYDSGSCFLAYWSTLSANMASLCCSHTNPATLLFFTLIP